MSGLMMSFEDHEYLTSSEEVGSSNIKYMYGYSKTL